MTTVAKSWFYQLFWFCQNPDLSYDDKQPEIPGKPTEFDELSDDEIVELCRHAPNMKTVPNLPDGLQPPFPILSENVIGKLGNDIRPWEAHTMELVRSRTSIPVPRVLRCFTKDRMGYIIMEFIKGRNLRDCWDNLSIWRKFHIACTLRRYVRQLRRVKTLQIELQVPGPHTDNPSEPLPCSGRLMGEYEVGPFNSKSELAMWFNRALRHAHSMYPYNPPALPFDESAPLVLTHGDLTPRNIILGDDGKVWIIDWGCSGVYPRWFEVSSMVLDSMQPRSWMWASRFAAGWYYRSQEYFAGLTNFTVSIIGFGVPIPFGEEYRSFSQLLEGLSGK